MDDRDERADDRREDDEQPDDEYDADGWRIYHVRWVW